MRPSKWKWRWKWKSPRREGRRPPVPPSLLTPLLLLQQPVPAPVLPPWPPPRLLSVALRSPPPRTLTRSPWAARCIRTSDCAARRPSSPRPGPARARYTTPPRPDPPFQPRRRRPGLPGLPCGTSSGPAVRTHALNLCLLHRARALPSSAAVAARSLARSLARSRGRRAAPLPWRLCAGASRAARRCPCRRARAEVEKVRGWSEEDDGPAAGAPPRCRCSLRRLHLLGREPRRRGQAALSVTRRSRGEAGRDWNSTSRTWCRAKTEWRAIGGRGASGCTSLSRPTRRLTFSLGRKGSSPVAGGVTVMSFEVTVRSEVRNRCCDPTLATRLFCFLPSLNEGLIARAPSCWPETQTAARIRSALLRQDRTAGTEQAARSGHAGQAAGAALAAGDGHKGGDGGNFDGDGGDFAGGVSCVRPDRRAHGAGAATCDQR